MIVRENKVNRKRVESLDDVLAVWYEWMCMERKIHI